MKFLKVILSVVLAALVVVLGLVVWGNYDLYRQEQAAIEAELNPPEEWEPSEDPLAEENQVQESDEPVEVPENTTSMTLAYCGDIVAHSGLNSEAQTDSGYDYTTLMGGASGYVSAADYAVCCLETTFPETTDYAGYPMFKSPKEWATSLSTLGFDMISTASNHCMDSYQSGLNATLDVLDENGLDHVGTYRSQEERDENNGIVVKEINGISIAFLAYTYGTNGIPVTGFEYAVNIFYNDYLTNLSDINYDLLEQDMAAARALDTDLIIVFMHWGYEYYTEPVDYQYELADYLFQQGADIILGGHTHVPEPMEVRTVTDIEGNEKTGYICYSLGNFVSCQNDRYTNLTAVVTLSIEKNLDTGDTYLKNVGYAPMFMVDLEDYGVYDAGWRYRLWDLHGAINAYESGDDLGVINTTLYDALLQGLEDIHSIFGAQFDVYDESYTPNTVGEMPVPETQ